MRRTLQTILLAGLVFAAAVLCFALFVIVQASPHIYESLDTVPSAQVALVLGASVASTGALSLVMQERADAALALYHAHKVNKILVSGDNATLSYNEVYPVGKYLLGAGVPQQDIFLDYAGFDTYSSVYRARDVFEATSTIIVSQRFHLPRALFLAHTLGLSAVGFDAAQPGKGYFFNYVREIPASIKALLDVTFARVPKYLGVHYPVGGDGSATWVGSPQMVYFVHG